MTETWQAVEQFIVDELIPGDPALDAALERSDQAGLPAINVTPNFGKLLSLLARLQGARRILEVGTLGGYSTIWLARALPDGGRLVTLEADPKHAAVARKNIDGAGLGDKVEIRLGLALDSLPGLAAEDAGPFDLVFIDADKPNNPGYLEWALKLTRPGSLIIVDNVVRDGTILDLDGDATVQGVRQTYAMLANDPRLEPTAIQTVGSKGYDGFALALVTSEAS